MNNLSNLEILDTATGLSEKTLESYRSLVKKINNNISTTKLKDVEGMKKVVEGITNNPNSQGNYYSVIMKILQLSNRNKLRTKYKPLLKAANKKHDDKPKKLNKAQGNVIDKNYEKLKHDYVVSSKKKGIENNISDIEFVLLFYVLLPPRRSEYYNMIYTKNEDIIDDDDVNFLFEDDLGYHLIFNNFKNVKKIGRQRFRIGSSRKERSLRRIIRQRKLKEGEYIYDKSRRQFTRDLGYITKKVFGEKLLINDLRIIHNTDKFLHIDTTELKKDAEQMGHSVQSKLNNYIRD